MNMRILATVFILGLSALGLQAQSLFEFGVKAGVNHAFPNSLSAGIESEDNFGWQAVHSCNSVCSICLPWLPSSPSINARSL
ncbi:MAG: hypothetical protein IPM83_08555 [Ignavibacteria bacterium]|nr:hypothetical protein [Ignavibacteria bacterium]